MDFQRMILFFGLAFVVMTLWTEWNLFNNPEPVAPQAQTTGQTPNAPASDGTVPQAPATPAPTAAGASTPSTPSTPGVASTAAPQGTTPGGERISVDTDFFVAEIDTVSGDVVKLELKRHAEDSENLDTPFQLLKTAETPDGLDVFITQTGLLAQGDFSATAPNHTKTWKAAKSAYTVEAGQDTVAVPLTYEAEDGVTYTKTWTFNREGYAIDLDYAVANNTDKPWTGFLYGQFQRTKLDGDGSFGLLRAAPSYKGGAIYTPEEKYEKISFDDMEETQLARASSGGWIGMLQHYFVGAMTPREGVNSEFYSAANNIGGRLRYNIGMKSVDPVTVAAGATGSLGARLFVGPKERQYLTEFSEGLDLAVDYGILTPISEPLFWVLNKIHSVVGNWGWAIVLLTVLIKLVFFPLSAASYKSMARMKKLQPRLQTLKERYGDDRAKLNQEMMSMYKEEKINPLGGCLPILVQIPVFIALYWVLLESVELRQAPWWLWIKDLSIKDPFYVLPLLMGASMLAQQFLNPAPLDPIQKNIMMALPVVFTFLFLFFPAGLVLYWLVNNCLSIGQQYYITRKLMK